MADSKRRGETIENRWDILYRDYPEVYDEFAGVPYDPPMIEVLHGLFDFRGKKVVDIGSGSGRSTFSIAAYAEHVIGVEPEASMRKIAEEKAKKQGVSNVSFVDGCAEDIPLDTGSVDMVVAITATMYPPEKVIPRFVEEAARVVRGGGAVVSVDVAPGWYGANWLTSSTTPTRTRSDKPNTGCSWTSMVSRTWTRSPCMARPRRYSAPTASSSAERPSST